jgi:hypothetical protein
VWRPGWKRSARKKALAAIPERGKRACEYHRFMRLADSLVGVALPAKVLDSGSTHEGVRGFESHSPDLILSFKATINAPFCSIGILPILIEYSI